VEVAEYGLNVSVIGDSGVSSITSGLPVADDEVPLEGELELLQAAIARLRTAAAARLFMTACLIA
jgi:hypothetical protein